MQFSTAALISALAFAGVKATITSSVTATVTQIATATVTSCAGNATCAASSSSTTTYGTLDAYGSTSVANYTTNTSTAADIQTVSGAGAKHSGPMAFGLAAMVGAAAVMGL